MSIQEEQKCLGRFGFGTGFAHGSGDTIFDHQGYCYGCPLKDSCWAMHQKESQRRNPREWALWDYVWERSHGILEATVAFQDQYGRLDPIMSLMNDNITAGMERARLGPK